MKKALSLIAMVAVLGLVAAAWARSEVRNPELGAPALYDQVWLYGSDKPSVVARIVNGGGAVMPAWQGRLDPTTIKALTVYVHSLGGGQ